MALRTPIYECHRALGAKFTEFGGWDMPVQYSSIREEHMAVRERVGLFDVSHMGEISVEGSSAFSYLQYVTSNDVSKLGDGEAQYSLLLNEGGGVVDDVIVYRLAPDSYLLCVNAANAKKDFAWMNERNEMGARLSDRSDDYAQLAIQGPRAVDVLSEYLGLDKGGLDRSSFPAFAFRSYETKIGSLLVSDLMIARTGYTGEDGFEIFCPSAAGVDLWMGLLSVGERFGIRPAGLGARDTLRLEVCYPLHGHELTEDIPALCGGLGWVVRFEKGDFIGRASLLELGEKGLGRKLVALEVLDRGILRHGARLFSAGGDEVGFVTSGTIPPYVNKAVAMAYVEGVHSATGQEVLGEVRGKMLKARVVQKPFLRK